MLRLTVLLTLSANAGLVTAQGLSNAIIYSIAFGSTAGVLFLAAVALLVFVCLRYRTSPDQKKRRKKKKKEGNEASDFHANPVIHKYMESIQDFRNEPPIDTSEPNTLYDEDPVPDPDSESYYNPRNQGRSTRPPYYNVYPSANHVRSQNEVPRAGLRAGGTHRSADANVYQNSIAIIHAQSGNAAGDIQTREELRDSGTNNPRQAYQIANGSASRGPVHGSSRYYVNMPRGREHKYRGGLGISRQNSSASQQPSSKMAAQGPHQYLHQAGSRAPSKIPEDYQQDDDQPKYENTLFMPPTHHGSNLIPPDYDYQEENEPERTQLDTVGVHASTRRSRSEYQRHLPLNTGDTYGDRDTEARLGTLNIYATRIPTSNNYPPELNGETRGVPRDETDDSGWTNFDRGTFPSDVSSSYAKHWNRPAIGTANEVR